MEEFEGKSIDAKFNLNELLGADEQFQSRIKAMVDSFEHLLQPFQLSEQSSIDFQLFEKTKLSEELFKDSRLFENFKSYEEQFKELKKNSDFNSSIIYINSLKTLLKNEEFCKSQKWVTYLEEQIELMGYLLDDSFYDPHKADDIKNKYISEDALQAERKDISKRANRERHKESRAAKTRAIDFYKKNHMSFSSKSLAAIHIAQNVVGYSVDTVRDWLKNVGPGSS